VNLGGEDDRIQILEQGHMNLTLFGLLGDP